MRKSKNIDLKEMINGLKRELERRLTVYPQKIKTGRMKRSVALYELAVLKETIKYLTRILERQNKKQKELF